MPVNLDIASESFAEEFEALLHSKREMDEDVDTIVADIIAEVRKRGDEALLEYTNRFDKLNLDAKTMSLSKDQLKAAIEECDPKTIEDLKLAAERIKSFHEKTLPANLDYTDQAGVRLGAKWTAIQAAGIYVPGGTASYPSSVLMNAIPAKVAGVKRLVMTVPTPEGTRNPLVFAAAYLAGVDEVYMVGGAQAVAALAYGTETIKPVDKITGPGNAFVAAAKRRVFGQVGIDMIAGPSEILVVADNKNDPAWVAMDLLSQAEHDVSAQSILITDDQQFADEVSKAVEAALTTLPRQEIARKSWEDHGAIIVVDNFDSAIELIDRLAPEHLELAVDDPQDLTDKITNAGSIFMGRYTPEAVGDYVAGPNHVLPTARSARFSSGLGVLDFMKRSTFLQCDADSLGRIGPAAVGLAQSEGLGAHARSVAIRLNMPVVD
ncbi:MAG: histidinol dehydrogenase [Alphaproteobacteria bacterium]|nr:histidinol dehydrogenase [Alphaproteobacteria bacterium]